MDTVKNAMFENLVSEYLDDKAFRLPPYAGNTWINDPRMLLFVLTRYKFCAKMLMGCPSLLEIGCGDSFHMPLLMQDADERIILGIDVIPELIEMNTLRYKHVDNINFSCKDIIDSPMDEKFSAAISLDILEHIPFAKEDMFLGNIAASLLPHSPLIIGTPNAFALPHAIEPEKKGHINLKNPKEFTQLLRRFFHSVFLFSMNDETIHTGYSPLAHYLLAIAVSPKK